MKFISFIIAVLLLFGLCSCSVNEQDIVPETEPAVTDEPSVDVVQEDEDDGLTPIYDNTAIVEAYRNDDASALDQKQLAIYSAALDAIGEFYSDGLSQEETVLSAHDWLVTHLTYDSNMLLPIPRQTEDTENPYGALVNGQGICMGYTTTFQLFMDMLGVESIIVRGSSDDEEHAWNMVRLDGEWYHVDVTWDDFVPDEDGRPPFHMYCLVPDYVMQVSHVWDRETAPVATAEDKLYYKSRALFAETEAESAAILRAVRESGGKFAEIMTPSVDEVTNYLYTYWPIQLDKYVITVYWIT